MISIEQVQLKEKKYKKWVNQPYLTAAEIILTSMNIDPDLVPRDVGSYYFKQFGFFDQGVEFDEKLETLNRLHHKKLIDLRNPPPLVDYVALLQQYGWEFPEGLINLIKKNEYIFSKQYGNSKNTLRKDVEYNFNCILLAVTEYFYSLPGKLYKHGSQPNSKEIGEKLYSICDELKISDAPRAKTISDYLRNSQRLRTPKKATETA